ncbi:hypothetical protein N2152v2_002601 [Parachlorella kessleri]
MLAGAPGKQRLGSRGLASSLWLSSVLASLQKEGDTQHQQRPILPPASVGDRLRSLFHSRRSQLLSAEKELRGRLYFEYTAQIQAFEPVLRRRGEMIGEVLLDAMAGDKASNLTYADIVQQSLRDTPIERLRVKELVQQLDPLITPILNPFVEGVQAPINKVVGDMKAKVFLSWAGMALAGAAAGFFVGRLLPRDGKAR